jgi:hypothetical protein
MNIRYTLQEVSDAIYANYQVVPNLECMTDSNGRQLLLGVNLCLNLDLELTSCAQSVYLHFLFLLLSHIRVEMRGGRGGRGIKK